MWSHSKQSVFLLAAAVSCLAGTQAARAQDTQGPSSSASPYVVSLAPGVMTRSILTVGDSVNNKPGSTTPYRMVGIPDGLGAFDLDRNTFVVLMNHELPGTAGVVRAHGAIGAFVSKWTIDKQTLQVLKGEDLIQAVSTWNPATRRYNPFAQGVTFNRFCSADLPPLSAFYYAPPRRGRNDGGGSVGYSGRLFMNGEEAGDEGRAFAHTLDGYSYELPRLGKFSWENALANPGSGAKTIVIGTDDTTSVVDATTQTVTVGGQVYVYVGDKTKSGSSIDRAGLTNGQLYGIKVQGLPFESRESAIRSGTPFSLVPLGNVSNKTGAELEATSVQKGVTAFLRPEDGHWDANNPSVFYFVTTDRFDTIKNPGTPAGQAGRTRLWRLRFADISRPFQGGKVDQLLDGTGDYQMFDNMTADTLGRRLIQEDPGNQPYVARVHLHSGGIIPIAQHDPNRFVLGGSAFLTQDEESSGIIDLSDILGKGYYLLDVQAHYSLDSELVQGGQLLAMYVPPGMRP